MSGSPVVTPTLVLAGGLFPFTADPLFLVDSLVGLRQRFASAFFFMSLLLAVSASLSLSVSECLASLAGIAVSTALLDFCNEPTVTVAPYHSTPSDVAI